MSEKVLASDRKTKPEEVTKETPQTTPEKPVMKAEKGGGAESISSEQLIKTVLIIVLIIALVIFAVWAYRKYTATKVIPVQ